VKIAQSEVAQISAPTEECVIILHVIANLVTLEQIVVSVFVQRTVLKMESVLIGLAHATQDSWVLIVDSAHAIWDATMISIAMMESAFATLGSLVLIAIYFLVQMTALAMVIVLMALVTVVLAGLETIFPRKFALLDALDMVNVSMDHVFVIQIILGLIVS